MKPRPIYRAKDHWVLCICRACATLNYVEPHGITARCSKCKAETEHRSIPHAYRDVSGFWLVRMPGKEEAV
jgi:hypothetical protein